MKENILLVNERLYGNIKLKNYLIKVPLYRLYIQLDKMVII